MRELAERLLVSKRKGLFRSKPLFEMYQRVTESSLAELERELDAKLPADLKDWLLLLGYGDVNEELSFRREWFKRIEQGALAGAVMFAQDVVGNFYAYSCGSEEVIFFSRSAPEYASVSPSFRAFAEELEARNYRVVPWVESLSVLPYSWNT